MHFRMNKKHTQHVQIKHMIMARPKILQQYQINKIDSPIFKMLLSISNKQAT